MGEVGLDAFVSHHLFGREFPGSAAQVLNRLDVVDGEAQGVPNALSELDDFSMTAARPSECAAQVGMHFAQPRLVETIRGARIPFEPGNEAGLT